MWYGIGEVDRGTMKGRTMQRVMRRWKTMRASRALTNKNDNLRPPLLAKRSRQERSDNSLKESNSVPWGLRKRPKRLVTLLVGKDRQEFKVEPHMLEHRLVQCLLRKTLAAKSPSPSESPKLWDDKENGCSGRRKSYAMKRTIYLNCDAILFDHILWLLNNDDPAIRQLNIEELMEFYE